MLTQNGQLMLPWLNESWLMSFQRSKDQRQHKETSLQLSNKRNGKEPSTADVLRDLDRAVTETKILTAQLHTTVERMKAGACDD